MPKQLIILLLAVLGLALSIPVNAGLKIVTSIAPVDSLVSGITEGVARTSILAPAGSSPHHYSLKPSDIRLLNSADLIVWVGKPLEGFLAKPLTVLQGSSRIITLIETPGLDLLYSKTGHDDAQPSDRIGEANYVDPHIWLSPVNAIKVIQAVTQELIEQDSANRNAYLKNADHMRDQIQQQKEHLIDAFKP